MLGPAVFIQERVSVMWITFTERHKVKQGDGNGPLYEQGQSYEFKGQVAETYARKYIARGIAVEGKPQPKAKPATAAQAAVAGEKSSSPLPGLGGAPVSSPAVTTFADLSPADKK
jgi:hypothetical protein